MLQKYLFVFACAVVCLFASCDNNEPDFPEEEPLGGEIEALVLNEGRITTNMGAISVLYKDGTVSPDIFREVNNRPLGDVAQSITLINGNYFVALDNSKKVEIVDPKTFASVGTILYTQAGLPRQIEPISDTEAIVSDLYGYNGANSQLVRIRTVAPYGEPLEYIPIKNWVEYMVCINRKLFGMTSKGLYVFDVDNISEEASRVIADVKNSEMTKTCKMLVDKNGQLWALMNDRDGIVLKCIDPVTEKVVKQYKLYFIPKANAETGDVIGSINYNRTDIDATKTLIYFNVRTKADNEDGYQQSVYTLNIDNGTFALHRHLPGVGMMYGCGVHPDNGDVYICDCLDYSAQRGYIRKFKADGTVDSYRVGVYPNQVFFPGN